MVERGVLCLSNCVVAVPQDKWYAAEYFGAYSHVLKPGLGWAGIDCCGLCWTLRSISSRVEQIRVIVPTKTRDHVFVHAVIEVQMAAVGAEALYKLANVSAQVDSYVSDTVRSELPKMDLDEAFEARDAIAAAVNASVKDKMSSYGYQIHKVLMTELKVGRDVVDAMNEFNKQRRLREATEIAAESDKIRVVKRAEAEAEAMQVRGEGIALERIAVVQGLVAAVSDQAGETMTAEELTDLVLATNYFETLKNIGTKKTCKTYFMDSNDMNDIDTQVRAGLLQGTIGLQNINSTGSGHGGGYGGYGDHSSDGGYFQQSSPAQPAQMQMESYSHQ